jgi:hypothetical protein
MVPGENDCGDPTPQLLSETNKAKRKASTVHIEIKLKLTCVQLRNKTQAL